MSDKKSKAYGLIMPKKVGEPSKPAEKLPAIKKPSIFDNESSDEDGPTDWRKRLQEVGQSKVKKQTKLEMSRALAEDPTVYQYDEVYDAIEAEKAEKNATAAEKKKNQEKKPRYIENLLKQAEIRNREKERRLERQVQKEREAEGDEFADKESFVTSAYRKKMEEMQKLEEEERKQDAIEEVLTVTKQKDMSGFYRHLYRQTMGEEKGQKEVPVVKVEPVSVDAAKTEVEAVGVKTEIEEDFGDEKDRKKLEKVKARTYRKIQNEESDHPDSDSEMESDSDRSSADDETELLKEKEKEEKKKLEEDRKRRDEMKAQKEKRDKLKRKIQKGEESSDEDDSAENEQKENINNEAKNVQPATLQREKKIKVDVWKKVTVGEVFECALERYFARKASRTRFP